MTSVREHEGAPGGLAGDATAAVITEKRVVADGVVTLELAPAHGGRLPDWTPGAHIDLILPNGLTRQYSLCGSRWRADRYRIGVLKEPNGRGGSAFVHDVLAVGDHVRVGGPRNNFALVPSQTYLFVAGGIGITPLLPMLHQADLLGAEWRLLYGGRRRPSMAFLDELADYGDRVEVAPQAEVGLLDLPAFLGPPRPDVKVFACGPVPLLDAIKDVCRPWPPHALRSERFTGQDSDDSTSRTSFQVTLKRSGVTTTVGPNETVLDAVRAAGAEILSSCRQGTCGTCETTVLAGQADHRDSILQDHERQAGDCMFPCVSRSLTDHLVLDL
jgi:ferredoxin-NADP reductase